MDANGFDHLTRTLSRSSARRGLLAFLAALPVPGGLLALLGDEAEANKDKNKDRDKKDKDKSRDKDKDQDKDKRHQHASDDGQGGVAAAGNRKKRKKRKAKKRKKKCKKRRRKICIGQCGQVTFKCNKRKKTVDCGACACNPPCPSCQRCNEANRTCEPDPSQQGKPCGEIGQVCQSNGTCRCDATSCGECGTCGEDGTCGELCGGVGCCDGATCQPGNENGACGTGGAACEICNDPDFCEGGVCTCTPITTCPPPLDCGEINNGCGGTLSCGTCTAPDTCGGGTPSELNVCGCTPTTCQDQGKNCGTISDGCGGTLDCGTCSNPEPICEENRCRVCSAQRPCPSGQWCDGGSCRPCDVCSSGCNFFSVQAAINAASPGATLHVCAGAYPPITVDKELTIIGAGRGDDPASDTILDAEGNGTTVTISDGVTATLWDLRITGGAFSGVFSEGDTTLNRCMVNDNERFTGAGGGGLLSVGSTTLNDCVVRNNAAFQAGGIHHEGTGTLTLNNTLVTRNHAFGAHGGGVVAGVQGSGTGAVHIISGSAITHNITDGEGGGLYVTPFAATTLDSSVEITGNDANSGGGIFAVAGSTIDINGATVEGNEPNNCVGVVC